jgi:tetratricopeptide (TPR) repeat protein
MQIQKQSSSLGSQTIENYIQRVTELSQLGQKIPSDEELNKIASELGITEEEIIGAKKQSEAHFIRAQGYYNLSHWDDAIDELQEAIAFNPLNLEMLHLLTMSHFGRWQEKHYNQDIQQIKLRIKQCLEIKPDHEVSLNLLSNLDKAQRKYQYKKVAIASAISIIAGSIIGYFWLNNISFNPFSKRDAELENLRTEFNQEITKLKQEQQNILDQFAQEFKEKEENNQTKINQLNNQLKNLQDQIEHLNRENQLLKDTFTKIEPLPNIPKNQPSP